MESRGRSIIDYVMKNEGWRDKLKKVERNTGTRSDHLLVIV